MGISDVDHRFEDGVPSVGVFECGVGEHTAIPADVFDAAVGGTFEPVAGAFCDIEFAVGIIGGAVFTGLVVVACAVHVAIVLGDVEIDCPRAEGIGYFFVGRLKFFFAMIFFEQPIIRCVVPEHKGISVC